MSKGAEREVRYPYLHVRTSAELAEITSDQLWTHGAQGVEERDSSTLLSPGELGSAESGSAELGSAESGSAGSGSSVPPARVLLIASFQTEEDAKAAQAHFPGSTIEYVVGDAWRHSYRAFFKPTRISPRIMLCPSWETPPPLDGATLLQIDPGNAFGSGLHETTRLVLREVDKLIKGGETVLDVGFGSGILSIAALLLGAASALGTEVEDAALVTAMENAEINGVADKLSVFGPEPSALHAVTETFEVVLANIRAIILVPLAKAIAERVAPGGTLVLSGVLSGEEDEVVAEYLACSNLELLRVSDENEWRALVFTRPS